MYKRQPLNAHDKPALVVSKDETELLQDLVEAEEDIRNDRIEPAETMFANGRKTLQDHNHG